MGAEESGFDPLLLGRAVLTERGVPLILHQTCEMGRSSGFFNVRMMVKSLVLVPGLGTAELRPEPRSGSQFRVLAGILDPPP